VFRRLLIILALAGVVFAVPAAAAPAAPQKLSLSIRGFVADDVGVFSAAFRGEMKERLTRIHEEAGVTVLLVSTGGTPGVESVDLAKALGASMEALGKARKHWVVFLLNPVEREFSVALSMTAPLPEGADPREAIESLDKEALMRRMVEAFDGPVTPFFKADDWEGGMRAGVDAIEAQIGEGEEPAPSPVTPPIEQGAAT
jgi:uncharacterized membrane protein YgcG